MTSKDTNSLQTASDGLSVYEFLANNIDSIDEADLDRVVDRLMQADITGQFCVSAARYLAAIDSSRYANPIDRLVKGAIDRDRERHYIGDLLESLWGKDYMACAARLIASDDNFRRIYKRVYPDRL